MANNLNRCEFIGRLGEDPAPRQTAEGKTAVNISLAVGSTWKDKVTGEKKESVEWVRVSAFGRLAEIMGEYLKKGSKIYISGRWRTQKWQDKTGADRYTTEVVANEMEMLGAKPGESTREEPPLAEPDGSQYDPFDDDINF